MISVTNATPRPASFVLPPRPPCSNYIEANITSMLLAASSTGLSSPPTEWEYHHQDLWMTYIAQSIIGPQPEVYPDILGGEPTVRMNHNHLTRTILTTLEKHSTDQINLRLRTVRSDQNRKTVRLPFSIATTYRNWDHARCYRHSGYSPILRRGPNWNENPEVVCPEPI